jgi:hypothetical protein
MIDENSQGKRKEKLRKLFPSERLVFIAFVVN